MSSISTFSTAVMNRFCSDLYSMSSRLLVVLSSLLILTLLGCSGDTPPSQDDEVLAQINDLKVTKAHFQSAFKRYYYKTGQVLKPDKATKREILNSEFRPYVLSTYAQDNGYHLDQHAERQRGMIERKVYVEEFIERELFEPMEITEQDLRHLFYKVNTQLRASHIYAATKKEADSLHQILQTGKSFESLAAETFENDYLAKNGGDLGLFGVDALDVAFERQVYKMKVGEISEPVRTNQGYSIIKLTEKHPRPIVTEYEFASNINRLRPIALRQKRELKKRFHLAYILEKLDLDQSLLVTIWQELEKQPYVLNFEGESNPYGNSKIAGLRDSDLSGSDEITFTVADLFEEARFTFPEQRNRIQNFTQFKRFVQGLAYRSHVVAEFLDKYNKNEPKVAGSIDQTFHIYLANRVNDSLRKSITVDYLDLVEEYEAKRQFYVKPLRMNFARIMVSDREKAEQVKARLQAGADFQSLLKQYSENGEDLMVDGELGLKSIKEYGTFAPSLAKLDIGDISEVIAYSKAEYWVLKVIDRVEPEPMSFVEARDYIEEKLADQKFKAEKVKLVNQVKKAHNAYFDAQKLNETKIQI